MENARRSDSVNENPKMRWALIIATGCERIGGRKRTNKQIQVPVNMWPCTIEEKLTLDQVDGKEVKRYETKITDNEGFTTVYPGKCPEFMENGEAVRFRTQSSDMSSDQLEEEEGGHRSGFATHPLPQPKGNKNGWISEEEEYEEEEEVDSDLESTATSRFNPT